MADDAALGEAVEPDSGRVVRRAGSQGSSSSRFDTGDGGDGFFHAPLAMTASNRWFLLAWTGRGLSAPEGSTRMPQSSPIEAQQPLGRRPFLLLSLAVL